MTSLRISLVSSLSSNEYDDKVKNIFTGLLKLIQDENPEFNLTDIDFLKFSYNDEPYIISRNSICTLTPSKYIKCIENLEDKVNAVLAIKKVHQELPYFNALFIANKYSEIDSINSDKIKRIYLVSPSSTSGYIAPLNKLWESGIISVPNERGIKEKGWEIVFVGNQRDVETEICIDKEAIGATGQFSGQNDPDKCIVKPILRYYNLPQDVIVVSNNLLPVQDLIIKWFENLFMTGTAGKYLNDGGRILSESSSKITGVSRIDEEFKNALNDLRIMINRVKKSDDFTICKPGESKEKGDIIRTTILFVAADPINTQRLRINKEANDIEEGLMRANKRDSFDFEIKLATKPRDLSRTILEKKPQILHFSGHGETEGIILENDRGKAKIVGTKALSELFRLFSDKIKCVFLNSCYSESQAREISKYIPYVIGMTKAVPDETAIAFAISFYDAIGAGEDIDFAFKFGKANIGLEGLTGKKIPVLIKDGKFEIHTARKPGRPDH